MLVCLEKALSQLWGVNDELGVELADGKSMPLFSCSSDRKPLRRVSVMMLRLVNTFQNDDTTLSILRASPEPAGRWKEISCRTTIRLIYPPKQTD